MILGLSHIALSCDDIEEATERLTAFGYAQRFDQHALENHAAKTPFLTTYRPLHHIRAFDATGAMAIELLDHGGLAGAQSSALIPVFQSETPPAGWHPCGLDELPLTADAQATLLSVLGPDLAAFFDPVFSARFLWMPSKTAEFGLSACVLPSPDPDATADELRALRFRPDASGIWSLLTPLPALQARLIPVLWRRHPDWAEEPLLDAPGCACLAMMARGLGQAQTPPPLSGQSVSFKLTVNGKRNQIAMIRPDHGPIIELIEQTT